MENRTVVSEIGEKEIIKNVVKKLASRTQISTRLGDDCGEYDVLNNNNVFVSTDKVPEDLIAFTKGLMTYSNLGRYLVEVNASDICSMGIKPNGILINISMPRDFLLNNFIDLYDGIVSRCVELGIEIIGGDTKFSSKLGLVGITFGQGKPDLALRRYGAKGSELVFVSGTLGLFGAALRLLLNGCWKDNQISRSDHQLLEKAITKPTCRIDLVPDISENSIISSCMDISDGLGQSLIELSEESDVRVDLEASQIAISKPVTSVANLLSIDPYEILFGPSLDLELLGTVPDTSTARLFCKTHGLIVIGRTSTGFRDPWIWNQGASNVIPGGYDQLRTDLHNSLLVSKT